MSRDIPFVSKYETVAASQTAQAIGITGKTGDILERLVVTVATSATGTVNLLDSSGGSLVTIPITAANTPIGVYTVELNAKSTDGGWKITTGAGASVLAVGRFS